MANIDAARGFIPVGSLVGGQYYPRSYPWPMVRPYIRVMLSVLVVKVKLK